MRARLLTTALLATSLATTALITPAPLAADQTCPKSYFLMSTSDPRFDPVFAGKDADGDGWVCVNANGPGIKAVVVIDDR